MTPKFSKDQKVLYLGSEGTIQRVKEEVLYFVSFDGELTLLFESDLVAAPIDWDSDSE